MWPSCHTQHGSTLGPLYSEAHYGEHFGYEYDITQLSISYDISSDEDKHLERYVWRVDEPHTPFPSLQLWQGTNTLKPTCRNQGIDNHVIC